MLKLVKFGPAFGLPDASPFVLKLETYLRLANLDYETSLGMPNKAPKKKIPYVILDGEKIGDSQFVIEALKKKYGDPLNQGLSAQQKGQHHFLRLGLEAHTYFIGVSYRWQKPENAKIIQDKFFGSMGFPGKLIFKIVQRKLHRDAKGQGLLHHSWEEIDEMARLDIKALENILGDQPFFGGDTPREIDCTTFGCISQMIVPQMPSAMQLAARSSQPLVAYHNRMSELVFPDYKDMPYNPKTD